jgi:hypothetical protein
MHTRPDLFSWIPRFLAVVGLLPFIAGFAWLTWDTASQSIERSLQWRAVQARVADNSAGPDQTLVKFIYQDNGVPKEVLISRSNGLKGVQVGEVLPLHINQVDPSLAEPARGSDLWATPGLLGFFLVFLIGCFIFLWRSKPMKMEIPPEFHDEEPEDEFEPEPDRFKPDPSRFARGGPPRERDRS